MKLPKTINILGVPWKLSIKRMEQDETLEERAGYCSFFTREIVIRDFTGETELSDEGVEEVMKVTVRHELLHATFYESGLSSSAHEAEGAFCQDEELIDWFAIQAPKLFEMYKKCGVL